MKIFFKILTALWIAIWFFIGFVQFLNSPKQIRKDKVFIEREIKPSVDFIKDFKKKNNRLPTNKEFYSWERDYNKDYTSDLKLEADSLIQGRVTYIRKLSDIDTDDQHKFKNTNWTKDFAVGVWRGEWNEYYFSRTNSYVSNNFSWLDGFIGLIVCFGIGIFPLLFWWLYIRRNKSST